MPTLNPEEPLNLVLDFGKYSPSADQRHAVISIVTELVEVLAGRRVPLRRTCAEPGRGIETPANTSAGSVHACAESSRGAR